MTARAGAEAGAEIMLRTRECTSVHRERPCSSSSLQVSRRSWMSSWSLQSMVCSMDRSATRCSLWN